MNVLRAILITESAAESDAIDATLKEHAAKVRVQARIESLPTSDVLDRVLRRCQPDVVLVSYASPGRGIAITHHLKAKQLGIAVVAVHPAGNAEPQEDGDASPGIASNGILEGVRAGAEEFLVAPFPAADVDALLERISRKLLADPPRYPSFQPIYSFLPAKPGVGASTLAVNLAFALARLSGEGPVMLGDLDLNSGMLQFLLQLRNTYSVAEALEYENIGDQGLWPNLVSRCAKNLDVLHSGPVNPNIYIDPAKVDRLLDHVEQSYAATCVDLSANLERYALAALERSRRIFLVTTPEMRALRAAEGKAEFLRLSGLAERTQILLNRAGSPPGVDDAQVEEMTGVPVAHCFANDYVAVSEAIEQGSALSEDSPFGKQCRDFASQLSNIKLEATPAPKRKLLGFLGSRFRQKESQPARQPVSH